MQQKISDNVHLGQTISPFDSIGKSAAKDRIASDLTMQMKKLKNSKE